MTAPSPDRRSVLGQIGAAAVAGLAGAPLAAVSSDARAQAAWPTKPVRLIVPFPPGGGTDAFARPLAKVLTASLGQPVVIDNRGGAGGTLGAELAAKSPPDGYTFLVGAVHHTIAVSMYPKLGYDLQKDLMPVTMLSSVPNVLVVNPQKLKMRTHKEFLDYARANPGKLNFASAGNGTAHQLTVELYKTLTRTFMTHIPYRGAGPALQDLLAGQVDFMFDGLGSAMPFIRNGRLVPLAVTSEKRSFALPEVPSFDELGVKGYDARTWYALWAPTGTPKDTVLKMQQAVAAAFQGKELSETWKQLGADQGGGTPESMAQYVDVEVRKWAKVVKDSGAKLD